MGGPRLPVFTSLCVCGRLKSPMVMKRVKEIFINETNYKYNSRLPSGKEHYNISSDTTLSHNL